SIVIMGSSVSGSRGARLQPVWRKGMTMTIGAVSTIILVVCKKLTPLVSSGVNQSVAYSPRGAYGPRRPMRPPGDWRMVGTTGGIDLDFDTRTGHKPARTSCRRVQCADTRPCGGCATRRMGRPARHGCHRRRRGSRCGIVKVYTPRSDLGPPPQG